MARERNNGSTVECFIPEIELNWSGGIERESPLVVIEYQLYTRWEPTKDDMVVAFLGESTKY